MNCQEVKSFIQAYLDGEFDEREWASLSAHLEICPSCKRMAQFEERFHQLLRRSLQPVVAPASLRETVSRALDAQREEPVRGVRRGDAEGAPSTQWGARWGWRLVPVAAVALLALGLLIPLGLSLSRRQDLALAEQSIEWHRRHLPLDVTGSSPETIQRYFADKVRFAVRPPTFAAPRAQLVGARLSNLREHDAAYLVYDVNGRRVSVFIFDADGVQPAGPSMQAGRRKVHWQELRGYNVLMYTSGGTGYAVTSDMDPQGLVQLVSHSD